MHVSGPPPARWASPSPVPVDPTCLEGLEVLQRLLLILQGVQRPHQQDDGEQAPWGEGGEEDGLSWILLCSHPLETLPALPKGPPPTKGVSSGERELRESGLTFILRLQLLQLLTGFKLGL